MDNLIFKVEGRPDRTNDETFRIWVDGQELDLAVSLQVRNHSPTGFNVGYGGSGPVQAALAICLHIFGSAYVAQAVYQDFKWTYVAHWSADPGFTVLIDLTDFVLDHHEKIGQAKVDEEEDATGQQWETTVEEQGIA